MSIRTISNGAVNNLDVASKTYASPLPPIPWVRNPAWPACEANPGDNRVRGLYAVYPLNGNFFSLIVSGAYSIDYGDGTTANLPAGGVAGKEYNWATPALVGTDGPVTFTASTDLVNRTAHGYTNGSIVQFYNLVSNPGVITGSQYFVINSTADTFQISTTVGGAPFDIINNGSGTLLPYRIATVTVTPQAGQNLTNINFYTKYVVPATNGYSTGWLDIAIASPTITALKFFDFPANLVRFSFLERVRLNQLGAITNFSRLFQNLENLQKVEIASTITSAVSTASMFERCLSLREAPLFNVASVTDLNNMFYSCSSLRSVPVYDIRTTGSIQAYSMFSGCVALESVPLFNTVAVANMSGMFSLCGALNSVPLFNTAAVTSMSSMFSNCSALQTVPLFNTAAVTSMSNMFQGCSSLVSVPLFNTAAVTTMASMFQSCLSLKTVPLFNTASVTDYSLMFQTCRALVSVPLFSIRTTGSVNMSNMFSNCSALQTVPLFNTAAVTSMSNMFQGCSSLVSVPLFNTAAVTTMASMFSNCVLLERVPAFSTSTALVNVNNMFFSCTRLVTVPIIGIGSVTTAGNLANMFLGCSNLSSMSMQPFRATFSVASCNFSGSELNGIYTRLPTVTAQTITVTGNYGTTADNPAIATGKGWTVTG